MLLVSYNIANLANTLRFGNFLKYLNKFDIFFLFETHVVEEKQCEFSSYFKNYSLYWIAAKKIHSAGRASGGCLYGFRKELQKKYAFKFTNISNNIVLSAKLQGNLFYFIPRYLNSTNWKNDMEKFEDFLQELNPTNFCLLGDLNARISNEQILDTNLVENLPHINVLRCSKDKKTRFKRKKANEVNRRYWWHYT